MNTNKKKSVNKKKLDTVYLLIKDEVFSKTDKWGLVKSLMVILIYIAISVMSCNCTVSNKCILTNLELQTPMICFD